MRYPGKGDAAGLVTSPRPSGKASTFSTKAPWSSSRAGSAVTNGTATAGSDIAA
ncbi:hypothetical protein D3C83_101680 [compost metagenome]